MIDKELFLEIVQNNHYRGDYTDGRGNYCLLGAAAMATTGMDVSNECPAGGEEFRNIKKALTVQIRSFTDMPYQVHEFNDDELRVSHEDIMLVAKKTVEEL